MKSYQATHFAFIFTLCMLVLSILIITVLARTTIPIATVLVVSTSSKPNLEMLERCRFHIFLLYVWSTEHEKTHNITRMLQLHLPGGRVWLDANELKKIGGLE